MGQILRLGKSGRLYKAQIAGNAPTAAEIEKFKNLVAQQGDELQISEAQMEKIANPPGKVGGKPASKPEEYGEEVVAHNEAELQDVAQYAALRMYQGLLGLVMLEKH